MRRRRLILGLGAGGMFASLGGTTAVLRLHAQPKRHSKLTAAHLAALDAAGIPNPQVLFIGNSMLLDHDVPALVAARAAQENRILGVATASAYGARLIETWRINELHALLEPGRWDAVVLQDFTKTPLRYVDRVGSAFAIRRIAAAVQPTPVVLYPPFPAKTGNVVYRDAGQMTAVPDNPADYADRTMAHYSALAAHKGIHLAPVPRLWLAAGEDDYYAEDGHHASELGAQFIADVLWQSIREVLA